MALVPHPSLSHHTRSASSCPVRSPPHCRSPSSPTNGGTRSTLGLRRWRDQPKQSSSHCTPGVGRRQQSTEHVHCACICTGTGAVLGLLVVCAGWEGEETVWVGAGDISIVQVRSAARGTRGQCTLYISTDCTVHMIDCTYYYTDIYPACNTIFHVFPLP